MLINWIELTDFTSHRNSFIEFAPGMNGILGPEGSGKSSVITALGIALFNFNPYNQKNLVRQGCRIAQIKLSFNSILDGQEYVITAELGASSAVVLFTPDGAPIARGKTDVYNQVKHHLGLPPETDLPALAENGIITRQGELVEPFVKKPSERKTYFSDLLGVDDYELAWEKLRDTAKLIDDKLAKGNEQYARLEGELKGLEDLDQKIVDLEMELSGESTWLADNEGRVTTLSEEIRVQEDLSAHLARQRLELARMDGTVAHLRSNIQSVRSIRAGYEAQLADIQRDEAYIAEHGHVETKLAEARRELLDVLAKLAEIKGKKLAEIDRAKKQIALLEFLVAPVCPVCNGPITPEKKTEIIAANQAVMDRMLVPDDDETMLEKARAVLQSGIQTYEPIANNLIAAGYVVAGKSKVEDELAACDDKIEQLDARLDHAVAESESLSNRIKFSVFDEEALRSKRAALAEVSAAVATAKARHSLMRTELVSLKTKQTRYSQVMQELAELERQGMALTDQKLELAAIREAIRKAGPMIAAQLVASISMQASAVFSELMREHEQAELEWREDYGLTIRASGTELDLRDDHVNGGKKTKAALAVRTALLNHLGSIGLIVLDEPTNNLEEKSKHLLAQSIGDICSRFGQGIIITHSDEFGSGLNHLVRLTAKNGITEVV